MSLANFPGGFTIPIGPGQLLAHSLPSMTVTTLDAANEVLIFVGDIITSDAASHTIDTTGSSALIWHNSAATFASGSTTVIVGLATVDTANGPSGRAVNVADVVTFDVSRSITGGGGGITTGWQTHVPTAGTKTIAQGDHVAFAVQMTARGGTDSIGPQCGIASLGQHNPTVTSFVGGVYANQTAVPNCLIVFSDGAYGWFVSSELTATTTRTWNSTAGTKEYGQLYQFPFPIRINGLWGWADPDNNFDAVLYSDPLGTPVAQRTVSHDSNTGATTSGRRFQKAFAPYDLAANTPIVVAYKPGASNISAYYKTLAAAAHRITDPYGATGYGVSRAAAAFSDANSSLEHYFIGLLAGGFEVGGGGSGRNIQINNPSLVA
jgi:hypothetical protein